MSPTLTVIEQKKALLDTIKRAVDNVMVQGEAEGTSRMGDLRRPDFVTAIAQTTRQHP